MKKFKNNVKGITLVSLITTIIVLLILLSIGTYSGIEVIKSSKFTKFTTEMKIMQTHVNDLYQKNKNGDKIKIGTTEYEVLELGKNIDTVQAQADLVFTSDASGITDKTGYRYFDKETIKGLNIEGIEEEFFINIEKRSVVSYKGLKYEDVIYYTLDQIPSGLYNVEHKEEDLGNPTFDANVERIAEGKWKITISNISYEGYINKWKVNYKKAGQEDWNASKEHSFIVTESGKYVVQLTNGSIKSEEKEIEVAKYTKLEYIESTGTQYIDTNYILTSNSKVEIKFEMTEKESMCIFGSRTSATSNNFDIFCDMYYNGIVVDFYDYTKNRLTVEQTKDEVITVTQSKEKATVNETSKNNTYFDFKTPTSAYIFYIANNQPYPDKYAKMKLYSCKIWENDVLVRDFIPVVDEKGVVCLYDMVENKYYYNQGTGEFEGEKDTNNLAAKLPQEYKQVEYIKLDSTDPRSTYIATEIPISEISTVICKYSYENFSSIYHPMMLSSLNSNGITSIPWVCTDGEKSDVSEITPIIAKSENLEPTEFIVKYDSSSENLLKIGGWSDNYWTPVGSYYYVRIYDKKNNLIFNGIPCYRKSDNEIEIGMYDVVGNKFYANKGTGAFEKGADVNNVQDDNAKLPSQYQQVEYIESTGTQYIDTGFIADSNTTVEMKVFNKSTATACLYCGRTGFTEKTFSAFFIDGNALRVDYGNYQYTNLMTITSDTVYTYKHDKNLIYVNDQLIKTKTLTESEFNTGYNMYLLASHVSGKTLSNIAKLELYYCKIWDNDVLVRDFIPSYKKDTGEIGLYDTVEGKFYTNQGTGTEDFKKGADVN